MPAAVVELADVIAFSSLLAAAVGGSLSLVASRALDAPGEAHWAFLTAGGTFIIYNLDRLRDVERDHASSPMRTAFVLRHRRLLYGAVSAVAVGFAAALVAAPIPVVALCAGIGTVGFFHRRLKNFTALKPVYVSLSWVAACVGIPWIANGHEDAAPWVAGILLASLSANLIASNLRDATARAPRRRKDLILWIARSAAVLGVATSFAGPNELHALAWIPFCECFALMFFRPTERYGQVVVDGALLIGALATSFQLGWPN